MRILPSATEQIHSTIDDQANLTSSWFRYDSSTFHRTPKIPFRIKAIQIIKMLIVNAIVTAKNV